MTLAAPLRLVTGAEPDPAGGAWMLIGIGLVAALGVALAWWSVRRSRRLDPREAAFACLARRLRVDAADRRLIERLCAPEGAPSPLAVLLTRGAMARAAGMGGLDRDQADALARRLHAGLDAAA